MKGDFTRSTFHRDNHHRSVRMQQGRVQVDADWNEHVDLTNHRIETEARDIIGDSGGPLLHAGFAVTPQGATLSIGKGRYYVDGILCENDGPRPVDDQPDVPKGAAIVTFNGKQVPLPEAPAGIYAAYMEVWPWHRTALEAPEIREVALGGPDTATREKTVWQVKLLRVADGTANVTCLDDFPDWNALTSAPSGKIRTRVQPDQTSTEPCVVEPGAGYRRLENQLYRVEVHDGGARGTATFKWSRENGSVVVGWAGVNPLNSNELKAISPGRDKVLGFGPGNWIELTDDTRELTRTAGTLVRLQAPDGNVFPIDTATATGSTSFADFPTKPRIRRWDSPGLLKPTSGGFVPLEDGVEVSFEAGEYRTGDYWLIPARTVKPYIEWPTTGNQPDALSAHGIERHFSRLAIVKLDAGAWTLVDDCRRLFPPATELPRMFYVSGDGQEACPDLTQPASFVSLPAELIVVVAGADAGAHKAKVRFTIKVGSGHVPQGAASTFTDVETDDGGIARCSWELDASTTRQQVEARLLDAANVPLSYPVRFNANLSVASQVAYNPSNCDNLAGAKTVQQALDVLCKLPRHGGCATVVGPGQEFVRLEEAIKTLVDRGSDICICLTPGDHRVENLDIDLTRRRPLNVAIHSCARGARILVEKGIQARGLSSFTLRDVEIRFAVANFPFIVADCGKVEVSSAHISGQIVSGALLAIAGAHRLRVVESVLEAFEKEKRLLARSAFLGDRDLATLVDAPTPDAYQSRTAGVVAGLAAREPASRHGLARSIEFEVRTAWPEVTAGELNLYKQFLDVLTQEPPDAGKIAASLKTLGSIMVASPATALLLADGGPDASLEENEIAGVLRLYDAIDEKPADSEPFAVDELKRLREVLLRIDFGRRRGKLRLTGNRLSRMVVSTRVLESIRAFIRNPARPLILSDVFQSLHLSECVVSGGDNSWLAADTRMSTNLFAGDSGDVGSSVARSALFVANTSTNDVRLFSTAGVSYKQADVTMLNPVINIIAV